MPAPPPGGVSSRPSPGCPSAAPHRHRRPTHRCARRGVYAFRPLLPAQSQRTNFPFPAPPSPGAAVPAVPPRSQRCQGTRRAQPTAATYPSGTAAVGGPAAPTAQPAPAPPRAPSPGSGGSRGAALADPKLSVRATVAAAAPPALPALRRLLPRSRSPFVRGASATATGEPAQPRGPFSRGSGRGGAGPPRAPAGTGRGREGRGEARTRPRPGPAGGSRPGPAGPQHRRLRRGRRQEPLRSSPGPSRPHLCAPASPLCPFFPQIKVRSHGESPCLLALLAPKSHGKGARQNLRDI